MSLQTFTQNLGGWLHVAFKDDVTEAPVEGLVHNSATYQIEKQGVVGVATKSTVSGDWIETDNGGYQIRLTSLAGGLPGDGVSNDTDSLGTHYLHGTINGTTVMFPYAVEAAGGGGGGPSAADIADAVWDEAGAGHVTAGSFGARVDAATTSRLATGTIASDLTAVKTKTDALTPSNLDVAVSTRLASGTVAADLTAVKAKTDALTPSNLDVAVSTRLASGTVVADLAALSAALAVTDAVADAILAALRAEDDNALTRATVLTREAVITAAIGAPLTTRVYKWDTPANYTGNGATGRTEWLVTISYHSTGHIATYSKAQV